MRLTHTCYIAHGMALTLLPGIGKGGRGTGRRCGEKSRCCVYRGLSAACACCNVVEWHGTAWHNAAWQCGVPWRVWRSVTQRDMARCGAVLLQDVTQHGGVRRGLA